MSVASLGQTAYSGSVFHYDTFNPKSYVGEPTTNLIPSPTLNAYPTYGNSWGTFNVNQYNNNTYFSIGTVSAVAGNAVTMSAAHPLRSYDVVTPQTTGGGLTAGTNYLVKKLSSTVFTLHAYNGSQDGSQGYINPSTGTHKVYDDFANDTRISINATSFPTMWWGPPHLPNSGLVKEIIPRGCNIDPNKPTDCIRNHFIRLDAVYDGMAHGVDAPVDIGSTYVASFWTRAVNANAVGQNVAYSIYNHGGVGGASGFELNKSLGALGVWQRHELTFVPDHTICISYWFIGGGPCSYDIANIQFEKKAHATPFVPGTRSVTQGLLDLTRNNTIDLTDAGYNSSANIVLNGSSQYFTVGTHTLGNTFTVSMWVKPSTISGDYAIVGVNANGCDNWMGINANKAYGVVTQISDVNNFTFSGATDVTNNAWNHICLTVNVNTIKVYLNGKIDYNGTTGFTIGAWDGTIAIGRRCPDLGQRYFPGEIGSIIFHRVVLSDADILNNFNVHKRRYGL